MRAARAGNAGLIASFVIAIAGAGLGAIAAYVGELGAAATASRERPASDPAAFVLREAGPREAAVRQVIENFPADGFSLERLAAPAFATAASRKPRIVIVLDDMGLDPALADRALSLPGPLAYSLLPYAPGVDGLASRAAATGGEVMLHLPMQPTGDEDPGPNALYKDMTGAAFLRVLEWNLTRFEGFTGVNNHMGSALTADAAAMKTMLAYLRREGHYFLDSVTTGATVARSAGAQVGAQVLARDVFLDPTPGDADEIRRQLLLVEEIARETGYAIAIGHPRPETLDVLGPWLTSAKARGFELTTPSALLKPDKPLLVEAPALRG
jgi:polysaccharide deacetylase 2 family uncharacterized protein YibQ